MDHCLLFTRLETELASGASRGADKLAPYASGGLQYAARTLFKPGGAVALITGFYIADAEAPAAETDGPLAAIAIAEALTAMGRDALVVTDTLCAPVLKALVVNAHLENGPILIADDQTDLAVTLAAHNVDTVFAIERPGQAADGRCYSMRGRDLSPFTLPFDPLFAPHSGMTRLAAGDGGNEIGMGVIDHSIISDHVDQGAQVASRTGADGLIVAGVSHWLVYGLAAAAQICAVEHAQCWRETVSTDRENARLQTALAAGALDGVTAKSQPTIDGMDFATHIAKRDQLFKIVLS